MTIDYITLIFEFIVFIRFSTYTGILINHFNNKITKSITDVMFAIHRTRVTLDPFTISEYDDTWFGTKFLRSGGSSFSRRLSNRNRTLDML